ncbi:unnamed protein product [Dimorphilus gyrociliatus]|uniref:Uncharacterized protein n=1 Tax=Dimorphilus gyrociliatus TaxID=2664684 RepID=A0A7I8VVI1_9ANNE|nr:unnamed protein product [Dimorphilus gyrociliatus]
MANDTHNIIRCTSCNNTWQIVKETRRSPDFSPPEDVPQSEFRQYFDTGDEATIRALKRMLEEKRRTVAEQLENHIERLKKKLIDEKERILANITKEYELTKTNLEKLSDGKTEFTNFRNPIFQDAKQLMKETLLELEAIIISKDTKLDILEQLDGPIAEVHTEEGFMYDLTLQSCENINQHMSDSSKILINGTNLFLMNRSNGTEIFVINVGVTPWVIRNRWREQHKFSSFSVSPEGNYILFCDRINGIIKKSEVEVESLTFTDFIRVDDVSEAYCIPENKTLVHHDRRVTLFNREGAKIWSSLFDNLEHIDFQVGKYFCTKQDDIEIRSLQTGNEIRSFQTSENFSEMHSLLFGIVILQPEQNRLALLSNVDGSVIKEFPLEFTPKTMAVSLNILNPAFCIISDDNKLYVMKQAN